MALLNTCTLSHCRTYRRKHNQNGSVDFLNTWLSRPFENRTYINQKPKIQNDIYNQPFASVHGLLVDLWKVQ